MSWPAHPPRDPYRRFNWTMAKMANVILYLMETRDQRKKGNKLAPENIAWAALLEISKTLLGAGRADTGE